VGQVVFVVVVARFAVAFVDSVVALDRNWVEPEYYWAERFEQEESDFQGVGFWVNQRKS